MIRIIDASLILNLCIHSEWIKIKCKVNMTSADFSEGVTSLAGSKTVRRREPKQHSQLIPHSQQILSHSHKNYNNTNRDNNLWVYIYTPTRSTDSLFALAVFMDVRHRSLDDPPTSKYFDRSCLQTTSLKRMF